MTKGKTKYSSYSTRDDWERESPELRRTGSSGRRSYPHDDSKAESSFENSRFGMQWEH